MDARAVVEPTVQRPIGLRRTTSPKAPVAAAWCSPGWKRRNQRRARPIRPAPSEPTPELAGLTGRSASQSTSSADCAASSALQRVGDTGLACFEVVERAHHAYSQGVTPG